MRDPALTNGNLVLLGKQGSGKTMTAQRFVLDCVCLGIRVVVLDRSTDHCVASFGLCILVRPPLAP